MNLRRLVTLVILLFLNLIILVYYTHQSRMIPLMSNENDLFKSSKSSSALLLTNPTINGTELLANLNFTVFEMNKFADNSTIGNITRDNADQKELVLPANFAFTLNPLDLCYTNHESKFTVVILVCSSVVNFKQRETIRETWGSDAIAHNNTGAVRLVFLLGKTADSRVQDQIEVEYATYKDIVQQEFFDSYKNLTLKSLMLLQWVSDFCPRVHYVMKTDDDMYINVPNLLKTLTKLPTKWNVIFGTLFRKAKPNRNPTAKWYVPKEQYNGDVFPDYLSGTGYVMTRDVVPKLLEASATLSFMVMEDVFITGLCASQRRVKRYNVRGFAYWKRQATGCAFKDAITGHHVTMPDMIKIWKELQQTPLMCSLPKKPSKITATKKRISLRNLG